MPKRPQPIQVVVLTYDRCDKLVRLLGDLVREADGGANIAVQVYDDGSPSDYAAATRIISARGWHYERSPVNHGKQRFWSWVSHIYERQKAFGHCQTWVMLPDDVRLCDRFFARAMRDWSAIADPKKVALTLLFDAARAQMVCWTGVKPEQRGHVDHIGWVDGAALVNRRYFELLNWGIKRIDPSRWARDPTISSGVGCAVSTALWARRMGMYRVRKSLLVHVHGSSTMNQEVRGRDDMSAVDFIDGPARARELSATDPVTASMAAIPSRESALRKVVASLAGQVDRLNVYLNGWAKVPDFLLQPWITVARSQDHGDNGDAGKMWWAERVEGYHFTVDDDLVYPPDYVNTLIRAIEARERKAVVGAHGKVLIDKMRSYYRGAREFHHCLHEVAADSPVHLLGTGALAYHTSTLKVRHADFQLPNMADIWFARIAKTQRIPLVVVKHPAGWLKLAEAQEFTIHSRHVKDDAPQTKACNDAAPWVLLPDPISSAARSPGRRGRGAALAKRFPLVAFWDKEARKRDVLASGHPGWDSKRWAAETADAWRRIEPRFNGRLKKRDDSILDFGGGGGRFVRHLLAITPHVFVVDISPRMLEIAERKGGNAPTYVQAIPGAPIGMKPNSAVMLWSVNALQHVPPEEIERVALDLKRVVKDTGAFFLVENTDTRGALHVPARMLWRRPPEFYLRLFPGVSLIYQWSIEGEQHSIIAGRRAR